VGANNYYLAFAPDAMRRAVITAAKSIGLNVLRAPAFLDCGIAGPDEVPDGAWRGVYFQYWNLKTGRPELNVGENGLARLDILIADAEQAGMRLILPLVNYWNDFGGMDRYVAWFGGRSRADFYRSPDSRAAYRSYVSQILERTNTVTGRRYIDEPAILAWELANEPRCETGDGIRVFLDWVREMSRWIKQKDPNHLVAVGDEGFFANGSTELYNGIYGVDCEAILQIADIDFGTFHMYPQAWKQTDGIGFGFRWIEDHLLAGCKAGKPMILEEYGMTVGGKEGLASATERDSIYRKWLSSIYEEGGAGDLAWMIASTDEETGEPYENYDRFTFYADVDVPSICAHAVDMNAGTGNPEA